MASDQILALPAIPEALRIAARKGTLVPFVGAGVSQLAGGPNWSQFSDGALTHFIGKGKLTHSQMAQIKHLSPRIKMGIARALERTHGEIPFRALLHPPDNRYETQGQRLYGFLGRLARTFVTTNYDEWLDQAIELDALSATESKGPSLSIRRQRRSVYAPEELTYENLRSPDTVIHLHGSVRNPAGMILTTRDYIRHYASDRRRDRQENQVLTFLETLFSRRNVLFLGYGVDELEILEYVVGKAGLSRRGAEEPQHFLIQGYFSHEAELMRSMQGYFLDECGIELMPFLKDQHDWGQLVHVAEYLAAEIPCGEPIVSQQLMDMEALLNADQ